MTLKQLEYIIIQIIWNAALNAGPYINELTDEVFYEAFNQLNQQILDTYLMDDLTIE